MTDLATDISPAPEPLSTTIDTDTTTSASGGGVPKIAAEEPKAPSLRDTISAVVKEGDTTTKDEAEKPVPEVKDDKQPKAEEKPEAKSDRAPDGKFAAKAPVEGEAKPAPANDTDTVAKAEEKSGEAKHYPEPPKNFLPDSKEMWRNVPRPVRRDIEIMTREYGEQMERSRVSTERYESIRPFDELAKSNGRDLRESLEKMTHVENLLRSNPIAGLDAILREIGPRKQDGGAISLYDVASHIVSQGPQAYQQNLQQVQQQQPRQPDPQVAQAQQELADTKARLIALEVIAPFRADHPRYDELQEPIAQFLQSGMISPSLSAPERLEAAYVYADRLHPASTPPAETEQAPAPESRAADSLNGNKSIRSAPGAVSQDMEPDRGGSIRDILRDETRKLRRS